MSKIFKNKTKTYGYILYKIVNIYSKLIVDYFPYVISIQIYTYIHIYVPSNIIIIYVTIEIEFAMKR